VRGRLFQASCSQLEIWSFRPLATEPDVFEDTMRKFWTTSGQQARKPCWQVISNVRIFHAASSRAGFKEQWNSPGIRTNAICRQCKMMESGHLVGGRPLGQKPIFVSSKMNVRFRLVWCPKSVVLAAAVTSNVAL
jgi:hypothetical protein